jgi:charged multivesicular body protein 4
LYRERLREQNALSDEIVNAITTNSITDAVDEEDLDAELEQLQQEQLDEQMLTTGSVPVTDAVHKMPAVANGNRMFDPEQLYSFFGPAVAAF